jgi:hypothetical protein
MADQTTSASVYTPSEPEERLQIKDLPKVLQPYADLEIIQNPNIPVDDKLNMLKVYGKNSKEWLLPRSTRAREFAIQMIIHELLDAKKQRVGTYVNLNERAIKWLVKEAQLVFRKEPMLLELEGPIKVTGDFHGQYYDLLRLFDLVGGGPPKNKFLLIGDFVDRGK